VHKAHEVFSDVTGGRPPYFSRLISGGNRSPPEAEMRRGQMKPMNIKKANEEIEKKRSKLEEMLENM